MYDYLQTAYYYHARRHSEDPIYFGRDHKQSIGPYIDETRNFLTQAFKERRGEATWVSRNADQRQFWIDGTTLNRTLTAPKFFDYAEERSKGLLPPPHSRMWPRTEWQREADRWKLEKGKTLASFFLWCPVSFFVVEYQMHATNPYVCSASVCFESLCSASLCSASLKSRQPPLRIR